MGLDSSRRRKARAVSAIIRLSVQLNGYVGNGNIEISDGLVNNLIATISMPNTTTYSIDVSAFLRGLITANNPFAGFMFRLPSEPSEEEANGRDVQIDSSRNAADACEALWCRDREVGRPELSPIDNIGASRTGSKFNRDGVRWF
jgi:hypothetical protein